MKKAVTPQQWRIMEALWTRSPMYLSELMDALGDRVSWTHATFLTYLKQLTQKGYVTYVTVRGSRQYSAAVSREQCVQEMSHSMLSRLTDKSAALFLSHMIKEASLSSEERDELKYLIDKLSDAEGTK